MTVTVCNGSDCGAGESQGGSGGPTYSGGGGPVLPTGAVFSGVADPGVEVVLIKDGALATTTMSGSDGAFRMSISDLFGGIYTFGVYALSASGQRSSIVSLTELVPPGSTIIVGNILIAPFAEEVLVPPLATSTAATTSEAANPEPQKPAIIGDLAGHGRVDIIDFSILAYWFGRRLPADILKRLGPGADALVDIKDFSILAYHWTG